MDRVAEFLETEFPRADERGLVCAVASAPKDRTAKLVYADWLDEHNDPRGEYLRLLVGKERTAPKTVKRLAALRKKCPAAWLSAVGELHAAFAEAKKQAEVGSGVGRRPKFRATCDRGLWDVHYSGDLMFAEGQLEPVVTFLARPDVSPVLRSIRVDDVTMSGTANGFFTINLKPLTKAKAGFPYLETVRTLQGEGVIIGESDEENAQLAKLLGLAPRLRSLVVASPPNASFFKGAAHPLEVLNVRASMVGPQDFVRNLTRCDRFPNLRELVYDDLEGDDFPDEGNYTPFEDFVSLLRSRATKNVEKITLSGVFATTEQMRELKKLRPKGLTARRHPYSDSASAGDGEVGDDYDYE